MHVVIFWGVVSCVCACCYAIGRAHERRRERVTDAAVKLAGEQVALLQMRGQLDEMVTAWQQRAKYPGTVGAQALVELPGVEAVARIFRAARAVQH